MSGSSFRAFVGLQRAMPLTVSQVAALANVIIKSRSPEELVVLREARLQPHAVVVDVCELLDRAPVETMALFADISGRGAVERSVACSLQGLNASSSHAGEGHCLLRFSHVPPCVAGCLDSLSEVRYSRLGTFVCVQGVVTRIKSPNAVRAYRQFQCRRCGRTTTVMARDDGQLETPTACLGDLHDNFQSVGCRGQVGQVPTVEVWSH